MARAVWLAAVVCWISVGGAAAQQAPGPEHQKLKQFEGSWDTVMEMAGQTSKGTAVYKAICGGMWLASDFQGALGGANFQGHGLDGYDQAKKKYVGVWVDSMSSAPMQFEGNFDPQNDKRMVMTGESAGPDGKPQKFKNVTEFKDQDQFHFAMYMVDAAGGEQLMFTIKYTRRK